MVHEMIPERKAVCCISFQSSSHPTGMWKHSGEFLGINVVSAIHPLPLVTILA